jgi:hypothetical protein
MSWAEIKKAINSDLNKPLNEQSLLNAYFGWAGSKFPYDDGADDIIISGPTTWADSCGYKKVGRLTIHSDAVLSIKASPFYIFAREIVFTTINSQISADGNDGSIDPALSFSAKGGGSHETTRGGDGGGMLFIVAQRIYGEPGMISANGGNGSDLGGTGSGGGQGCFDPTMITGTTPNRFFGPLASALADGGGSNTTAGAGGGSGSAGYGGSGIGGGGGRSGGIGNPAKQLTPAILLELAKYGCLGGGGGGGSLNSMNRAACGGGGGSVCVWVRELSTVAPILQANGGVKALGSDGGAGITHLIKL